MDSKPVFPNGASIPLVYQYHLLRDEERMQLFARAIRNEVKPGDVVLDLGCGTGIMSYFAAKQGAKVLAIERDPRLAERAKAFLAANGVSAVQVICGDVTTVELPPAVDGIICEMMFVGLLVEPQWQVIRSVCARLPKAPRYMLPCSAKLSLTAGQGNFCYHGYKAPFAHAYAEADFTPLTPSYPYASICFDACPDKDLIQVQATLPVTVAGRLDAVKLATATEVGPGLWSMGSSEFCWPFIFPMNDKLEVRSGDCVLLSMNYRFGADYYSVRAEAKLVEP